MKYLIAGLGNIGSDYDGTRHNIGFDVVDHLAREAGVTFSLESQAHVARMKFKGRTLILIKPTTYMNLSGKAIRYWMTKENISIDHVLVLLDDLNLPLGKLRMRGKGSDGGHNGLRNIQEVLGCGSASEMNSPKVVRSIMYWENGRMRNVRYFPACSTSPLKRSNSSAPLVWPGP